MRYCFLYFYPFVYLFIFILLFIFFAELWFYRSKRKEGFNKMAVSYHCALKTILGVPKFYSNHLTCYVLGAFNFNHFLNIEITKFIWWIIDCQSLCFYTFKNYFLKSSTFIESIAYEVPGVLVNDRMALLSRISFVQNREPSSLFVGFTLWQFFLYLCIYVFWWNKQLLLLSTLLLRKEAKQKIIKV